MRPNELAKLRDGAYENARSYKERTKKWHDSRLRSDKYFKVGEKVLLYNSRLKMYLGKHNSKWSGPNIVKKVYPYGAVEIIDKNEFNFKVNGQQLKINYKGNIDKEDDEVIEFKNGVSVSNLQPDCPLIIFHTGDYGGEVMVESMGWWIEMMVVPCRGGSWCGVVTGVMHAYDAIIPPQVPIPPPTIVPPPPMLSPIFNPQEFFILEELLPHKEKMAPKRTSTSVAPAMTQAVIWNTGPRETPAARKCTYNEFISCQPFYFNVKKMEDEFYNLVVKGNDLKTYSRRFQELATICPNMVPNNEKLMDVFIGRLPQSIEGTITALKPQTLEEAINIA
nr:hypothetical protein [Tanacetum cinerariifolium]